jgi:hypothetical protein
MVPDSQHVPVLLGDTPARTTNEDEMAIVSLIDGATSIEQIALSCRLPEFVVVSFVYRAIMDDAVRLNPPSEEHQETPGLSDAAWHEVAEEIFERLQQGRLLDAFKMHATLLEKYSSNRDAVVVASRIEEEIGTRLDAGPLAPEASLEPAFDLRQIMTLECDPAEGFVLSRITGRYTVAEILRQLPGPTLQNRVLLHNLVNRGLVKVRQATAMAVFEQRGTDEDESEVSAALRVE